MMRKLLATILVSVFIASNAHADWGNTADKRWRSYVANIGSLPTVGNNAGDVRYVIASNSIYGWDGASWICIGAGGIDELVKVSAADTTGGYLDGKLLAGDGLSKAIVNPGADEDLNLYVNVDNSSIEINTDILRVKALGITTGHLNTALGGEGSEIDAGTGKIDVLYDNSTIGLTMTNQLEVKDGGITEAKLDFNNAATTNYLVRWSGTQFEWVSPSGAVQPYDLVLNVNQVGHSLAVGDVVRWDSGTSSYLKAQADSITNAEVVGIVSAVAGPDDFVLTITGYVDGVAGMASGTVYFLSATVAGQLTATPPSTVGHVNKPLFIATSATTGYFINYRGMTIGAATAAGSEPFVTVSNTGSLTAERALTAGSAITVTDGGANSTITVGVTADSIGDTQLTYNTGQHLTTSSKPSFAGVTLTAESTLTGDIMPSADITYSIGDNTHRLLNLYAQNVYSGDLRFENDWKIVEDWEGDNGLLLKSPNGKTYRFVLEEVK